MSCNRNRITISDGGSTGKRSVEEARRVSAKWHRCALPPGTSIGPPGSGGTAPSSSSLLLAMNSIGSSSLLKYGAVALRNLATLFLLQDTSIRILGERRVNLLPCLQEDLRIGKMTRRFP